MGCTHKKLRGIVELKLGEGCYAQGRNLYLPRSVADALGVKLRDIVEYHTDDGRRVYMVKKEA